MSALTAGLSPERLAVHDRILTQKYLEPGLLPGLQVSIWRGGELAHRFSSGMMDLERRVPLRDDAIFRIYSMTKPIIAVALLILLEEDRIDLGDEVASYIPQWRNLRVMTGGTPGAWETAPLKRPMRVIDLARHTSGLVGGGDSALGQQ